MKEETRKREEAGRREKFSSWAELIIYLEAEYNRTNEEVGKAEQAADEAYRASEVGKAFKEFDMRIARMSDDEVRANRSEINLREEEAEKEYQKCNEQFGVGKLRENRSEAVDKLVDALDWFEAEKLRAKESLSKQEKKALNIYDVWTYNPD